MPEINFMSALHKSTQRDYLSRVNDSEYPKAKAAKLAKQFSYDYWDGDRRICYGGYRYLEGRWETVARAMVDHYQLPPKPKILDVGCGKGYLLYDFLKVIPDAEIYGIDISDYAISIVNLKFAIIFKLVMQPIFRGLIICLTWLLNHNIA